MNQETVKRQEEFQKEVLLENYRLLNPYNTDGVRIEEVEDDNSKKYENLLNLIKNKSREVVETFLIRQDNMGALSNKISKLKINTRPNRLVQIVTQHDGKITFL